jgi:tetratricopeptide (TPR) repeat protein
MDKLKLGSYNNLGAVLQSIENWEEARKAFEITVVIEPSFAMGYYNLGMVLRRLERLPEAIQAYSKAIQIAPKYAEAYQNLGVALLKFGNYQDGVKSLQTASQLLLDRGEIDESKELQSYLRAIGVDG